MAAATTPHIARPEGPIAWGDDVVVTRRFIQITILISRPVRTHMYLGGHAQPYRCDRALSASGKKPSLLMQVFDHTPTSLGATAACPRVCAHMAYAVVSAPFQTTTAPNTARSSGLDAKAETNLSERKVEKRQTKRWMTRALNALQWNVTS